MAELLTAKQMRAVEGAAIESGRVSGLELMERAGKGVVEAIFERWPELAGRGASPSRSPGYLEPGEAEVRRVAVLCGPGNNGGDGFVVARNLHQEGWKVDVFLLGDPDRLPPDARINHDRWKAIGSVAPLARVLKEQQYADLYVDAVFGTGLTRAPDGDVLAWAVGRGCDPEVLRRTVSVDIPSGLCADSGRELGAAGTSFSAALTVSFHRAKPGHYLGEGPTRCGHLVVKDIGLGGNMTGTIRLVEAPAGDLGKPACGHKYGAGHALVLSGGSGRSGAARLAARGALRMGAGLVTLAVPQDAWGEVASQITAIMMRACDSGADLVKTLLDRRLRSVCLGPGLGVTRARELVPVVLETGRPTVLDADALSAFAEDPTEVLGWVHNGCVLTPHGGEFARLFPDLADKLRAVPTGGPAYSKVDATRDAARRAGCVVMFKGPDTVISAPDGRCAIHAAAYDRAAPWLATAGSGDVLAGFVAGLMARGMAPMRAAETAAWLHVDCALKFGPGLIAEDIPEMVPVVLKQLDV